MTCGCISDWSAIGGGEDEEEEKITITSSIDFLNLHSTQKKYWTSIETPTFSIQLLIIKHMNKIMYMFLLMDRPPKP